MPERYSGKRYQLPSMPRNSMIYEMMDEELEGRYRDIMYLNPTRHHYTLSHVAKKHEK